MSLDKKAKKKISEDCDKAVVVKYELQMHLDLIPTAWYSTGSAVYVIVL
jgi:hypothetical protein